MNETEQKQISYEEYLEKTLDPSCIWCQSMKNSTTLEISDLKGKRLCNIHGKLYNSYQVNKNIIQIAQDARELGYSYQ